MRTVSCCLIALALAACGEVVKGNPDAPAPLAPSLTSVEPARGTVSAMLTLSGSSFGEAQEGSTITIGGTAATVQTWSDTSIVAAIPDVLPGDVPVVVTTGAGTSEPEMVRVILPPRVYIENGITGPAPDFDSITVMSFDPATGALAELGVTAMGVAHQSFGGCITSLVVHEGTRRLFAGGTNGVAVFAIDPISGMLTHVPGSPFLSELADGGGGIDIDAAGNRLWRAGSGSKLIVYNIGPNGALTQVPGSPFAAAPNPDVLTGSLDGTFVYANSESSVLHAFSVTANGALTPLPGSPYATAGFSFSIARRPATDQLFLTIGQALHVWQPAVGTGVPAPIAGSPFAFTAVGGTPHFVTFTPDGNRAYIGVRGGSKLVGMNLAPSGTANVMPGSPFDFTGTFVNFSCMKVSREGTHLIGNDEGGKRVGVFALDTNGVPTHVPGSPFAITTQDDSSGLAITF